MHSKCHPTSIQLKKLNFEKVFHTDRPLIISACDSKHTLFFFFGHNKTLLRMFGTTKVWY